MKSNIDVFKRRPQAVERLDVARIEIGTHQWGPPTHRALSGMPPFDQAVVRQNRLVAMPGGTPPENPDAVFAWAEVGPATHDLWRTPRVTGGPTPLSSQLPLDMFASMLTTDVGADERLDEQLVVAQWIDK
ncbi:MAG: hypothetical protein P4L86_06140 [Mycobacterium sp.]|nr:hypothetical protein [Mycobacterium sp.]